MKSNICVHLNVQIHLHSFNCTLHFIQLWAWERIPIGRPRVLYVPQEGATPNQIRAAKKANMRLKEQGAQIPEFGAQFRHRYDSLAVRWLHLSYAYDIGCKTLLQYRDALDRQRDDEVRSRINYIFLTFYSPFSVLNLL